MEKVLQKEVEGLKVAEKVVEEKMECPKSQRGSQSTVGVLKASKAEMKANGRVARPMSE